MADIEALLDIENLTDYEKSLVDEEIKATLDELMAALVAYDIVEGDGSSWTQDSSSAITFTANGAYSNIILWIALLFIGGGLTTLSIYDRKRKVVKR